MPCTDGRGHQEIMSAQSGVGQHSMGNWMTQIAIKFLKVFQEPSCAPICVVLQKTYVKRCEIASDDDVDKISKFIYKKDALSIVSNAYSDF